MDTRLLTGLVLGFGALTVLACGGGSGGRNLPARVKSKFFVTGSAPANDSKDVKSYGVIRIHFSEAADPATLNDQTVTVLVDGTTATTQIDLTPDGQTAEVAIGDYTPPGAEIVCQLAYRDIRNLSGQSLNRKKGPTELRYSLVSPETNVTGGSIPASLVGRFLPASCLLVDGRMLVSGGLGSDGSILTDSEVVAADGESSVAAGDLVVPRWGHQAVAMLDGRVVTAGGFTDSAGTTATAAVEIFDPATRTYTAAKGELVTERATFALVRTADGVVLAIGGVGSGSSGGHAVSAAVGAWDPYTESFVELGGAYSTPITDMTAVPLPDGTVLVVGGIDDTGSVVDTAWIVDAIEDEVNATGSPTVPRRGAGGVFMSTGEALIAGGESGSGTKLDTLEIYDPAAETFRTAVARLTEARSHATVVNLGNGAVAIIGGIVDTAGTASNVIDVYDPSTDAMISSYTMSSPWYGGGAMVTPDGGMLLLYGSEGESTSATNNLELTKLSEAALGTQIDAPRIVSVSPLALATGVDVDARITVRISKAVDPSTVSGAFTVTNEEGKAVAGTVTTEDSDTLVVFTPTYPLGCRQKVSVEVATTIRDRLGNPLHDDSARKWSFTTTWDMVIGALDDGSQFGYVTRAGDVNGDGYDDIVVSAYVAESAPGSGNKEGQVYVIFGRSGWGPSNAPVLYDLSASSTAADLVITAETAGDQLGPECSLGVADIDKDGYDDIIVGAHFGDGPTEADSSMGELFVIFGKASFPSKSLRLGNAAVTGFDYLRVFGAKAGDKIGEGIAFGDVDADGYLDIITSGTGVDEGSDSSVGGMYVIFGASKANLGVVSGYGQDSVGSGAKTIVNAEIFGWEKSDRLAWCVAAGDVDGDGYADVVGGATGGDGAGNAQSSAGDVIVVFGGARTSLVTSGNHESHRAGPSIGIPACCIHGELKSDFTGWSVDVADLDGDGKGDIAIGARLGDGQGDAASSAGDVAVIFGDSRSVFVPSGTWGTHTIGSSLASPKMLRVFGEDASDNSGDAVLIADADGDGNADLLIGSTGGKNPMNTGSSNIGEVSILRSTAFKPANSPREFSISRTSMPADVTLTRFYGRRASDRWGTTLAVGDFNGDGHPDFLTGANLAQGLGRLFSKSGEAYVMWGRSTWWK